MASPRLGIERGNIRRRRGQRKAQIAGPRQCRATGRMEVFSFSVGELRFREAFGAAKPETDISWTRNFLLARMRGIISTRGSAVTTARTLVLMPVLERGPGALAVSCLVAVAWKRGSTP